MKNSTAVVLICLGFMAVAFLIWFILTSEKPERIYTFEECATQGNEIREVNGKNQCVTKQGRVFFEEVFCGSSTNGFCSGDEECVAGGCSGQTCKSVREADLITTCEWKECYDSEKYSVECRCVENKCKWDKNEAE